MSSYTCKITKCALLTAQHSFSSSITLLSGMFLLFLWLWWHKHHDFQWCCVPTATGEVKHSQRIRPYLCTRCLNTMLGAWLKGASLNLLAKHFPHSQASELFPLSSGPLSLDTCIIWHQAPVALEYIFCTRFQKASENALKLQAKRWANLFRLPPSPPAPSSKYAVGVYFQGVCVFWMRENISCLVSVLWLRLGGMESEQSQAREGQVQVAEQEKGRGKGGLGHSFLPFIFPPFPSLHREGNVGSIPSVWYVCINIISLYELTCRRFSFLLTNCCSPQ